MTLNNSVSRRSCWSFKLRSREALARASEVRKDTLMRAVTVVALAAVAGVGVVIAISHREASPSVEPDRHPEATGHASSHDEVPHLTRIDSARHLEHAAHARLSEEIHAAVREAVETRAAQGTPTTASGTSSGTTTDGVSDPIIRLEDVAEPLSDALHGAVPVLAQCFSGVRGATASANMKLVSYPEIGTVIDTAQVTDSDGHGLPESIEQCLRDQFDTLALPSLGQPGTLQLSYTFKF